MRWPTTELTERLGIRYPIIQAPMAGSTPPALVAAVSNAGGLGSLGAALLPPDDLRRAIGEIRRLTDKPFNVNLFAWRDPDRPDPAAVAAVVAALGPYRARLGVPDDAVLPLPPSLEALLEGQLAVVCDEAVPVFSFTFGIPSFDKVQATGAVIMGTATTVDEAVALEQAGVDVLSGPRLCVLVEPAADVGFRERGVGDRCSCDRRGAAGLGRSRARGSADAGGLVDQIGRASCRERV